MTSNVDTAIFSTNDIDIHWNRSLFNRWENPSTPTGGRSEI